MKKFGGIPASMIKLDKKVIEDWFKKKFPGEDFAKEYKRLQEKAKSTKVEPEKVTK